VPAEGGIPNESSVHVQCDRIVVYRDARLAATNLNSSRSNIYRLTYPGDLVSRDQAKAILAELDRMGPADEAKLKQWLPANFKRFGIASDRVKKLVVLPRDKELKEAVVVFEWIAGGVLFVLRR
jgi:hypothetical protein